jgi:predicted permease
MTDLRLAARLLAQSPGFALAAIATLALGIGANTAVFSLIESVILRPLPYNRPANLVVLWNPAARSGTTHLSVREILAYRAESQTLSRVATYAETNASLTGEEDPLRVPAAAVSADLFDVLGVEAAVGRTFVEGEDGPDAAAVVMLGDGLWHRRFGGRTDILGQTIRVNGRPRTVVGIMPPGFQLPLDYRAERPTEIWYPLLIDGANPGPWGSRSYFGIARLADGVMPAQVATELKIIADRWVEAGHMRASPDSSLYRDAIPVHLFVTGRLRAPFAILLAAAALVLLIACANVINLMLARADARRREVAVRTALGARRWDLVRQLLIESLMLSALAGAAGVLLAKAAIQLLVILRPVTLPRVDEATLDVSAIVFATMLALVTALLFGLAPALQLSRRGVAAVLNEAGRGAVRGRTRAGVRRALVVAQLAVSVVLVVAAGLLLRTLLELNRVELGFEPEGVLTAQLQLPVPDYPDAERVTRFYRDLIARLEQAPGVLAAGAVRVLPLARTIGDWSITVEGRPLAAPNENPNGDFQAVTPGYFTAMNTRLLRGRLLTAADHEDAPPVVVVNDTMAARYWPGQDAIGKRFQMGGTGTVMPPMEIVGIVRTSRHNAIVEEPRAEMYLPHAQLPRTTGGPARAMAVVIKTEGRPADYAPVIRRIVRDLDRNLPVADVRTMEDVTAAAMATPRFAAMLLGMFAALALTIAAIGTYAMISLLVTERAFEIGIRMALGAGRTTILSWVMREGLLLAGGGVALGLGAALLVTRTLTSLLYGVGSLDALTFAAVAVLLTLVAAFASWQPARRAAALDPVAALRQG